MKASSEESVELLHELAADVGALDQELLVVAVELVELAGLAGLDAGRPCSCRAGPAGPSSGLQFRAGHQRLEKLLKGLLGPERSGSVRAACRPARSRASVFSPAIELACPVDLGLDGLELGRGQSPGRAAGARRDDEFGALAASTIKVRGAIKLATSASPNCSRRPKTLRSTGCRQTSLRSSK